MKKKSIIAIIIIVLFILWLLGILIIIGLKPELKELLGEQLYTPISLFYLLIPLIVIFCRIMYIGIVDNYL